MSSSTPSAPTVPAPIRAVIELFDGPLADVRFAELDRDALLEAEAEVETRRAALTEALETVAAARAQLDASQATLLERARQAHAYARVYAGNDAALVEALDAIKLDGRALAPKKRGRPRKSKSTRRQTSLAVADDAA